jgi:dynein heavy chain, axonemal
VCIWTGGRYGKEQWRDNLKECLLMAGVDDKPVVFLFSDTQIVMEQMLEDVNSVLNSGDVPNLYGTDEMEKISSACKNDCVKKRIPPTKLNIFAMYLVRVRRNIHIVLCMSPLGEAFRTRLRMFPSIVNCCTIDWFSEWPDEALKSVATRAVQQSNLTLGDHGDAVISFVKHIHQSVADASREFKEALRRNYYVTPTSYLELLSTYRGVLLSKREEVGTLKNRLQVGLDKLISTAVQVETLQVQLTEMEPVLIATQAEVEQMIINITRDKADAADTQKVVAGEEAAAMKKAAETKAIADDAQRDLDMALPALDAAVACLKDLKKADIDEVKGMGRPPAGVKLTMEAICTMFDIKAEKVNDPDNPGKKIMDYFKAAQKNLLTNAALLLENMQNYDKDNIPERIIKSIEPFMTMPEFEPNMVEKASKACKAMCM